MCGIAGVVGAVDDTHRHAVRLMCEAMRHRGPDDEGFADGAGFSLGMRRLAIIDVAHGQQPVTSEDGRITAVFNGEIYNFHALQDLLRSHGHVLASSSDSECLPHLYEEYGADLVTHLRGMFGIAIWDDAERQLTLARDRAGKKPLYYWVDGPRLWFASELKCLLAVPHLSREVDPVAIHHYLTYQYVPQPWSILAEVRKLPPAHTLSWRRGKVRLDRYWSLDYPAPESAAPASVDELAEQLREQLLEATRIRMVSERPLGAFLSGGLDSSAVVAAMARVSSDPVSTFSIGFAEEEYNELPYARRVAEQYGTRHTELLVTPDIDSILPKIAHMFDEPFADSSAVPSYYVAHMARRHVVVVLNGDGGDESLGGYSRYPLWQEIVTKPSLPKWLRPAAARVGATIQREPRSSRLVNRAGTAATMLGYSGDAHRYAVMMSYFQPAQKAALYRPEFAEAVAGHDSYQLTVDAFAAPDTDPINRLLAADVALYLPGDLLPKVDITTMSVSLEARSPLLDHTFMEWAARLPGSLKVAPDGTTKTLFKKALEPWLPHDLIHRPKMGFGIPREEWVRGPLRPMVHDLLLSPGARVAQYLRPDAIADVVRGNDASGGSGNRVWALLMLELWHREVQEGAAP